MEYILYVCLHQGHQLEPNYVNYYIEIWKHSMLSHYLNLITDRLNTIALYLKSITRYLNSIACYLKWTSSLCRYDQDGLLVYDILTGYIVQSTKLKSIYNYSDFNSSSPAKILTKIVFFLITWWIWLCVICCHYIYKSKCLCKSTKIIPAGVKHHQPQCDVGQDVSPSVDAIYQVSTG